MEQSENIGEFWSRVLTWQNGDTMTKEKQEGSWNTKWISNIVVCIFELHKKSWGGEVMETHL